MKKNTEERYVLLGLRQDAHDLLDPMFTTYVTHKGVRKRVFLRYEKDAWLEKNGFKEKHMSLMGREDLIRLIALLT
jgi:hypothetical protein